MRRTARLPLALLLAGLTLGGCATPTPMPTVPPATAEPVFASDEEALAAAEEAYGAYMAAADAVINDGGAAPERIQPFVSEELFGQELGGYQILLENGWRGTGTSTFSLTLQRFDDDEVVVYACDDVSATDVVDASGNSVIRAGRASIVPYEVELDPHDSMRIVRKELWGAGAC